MATNDVDPGGPGAGHDQPDIGYRQRGFDDSMDDLYGTSLTVAKEWKVGAEINEQKKSTKKPSKGVTVFKWLATLLMFCLLLAALVASKLSALYIAQGLNKTEPQNDVEKNSAAFEMVITTTMCPYLVTLIVSLWVGSFRSDMPWPSWTALILGLLASSFEVCGILILTLAVLRLVNPVVAILLLNSVYLAPGVVGFFSSCRQQHGRVLHRVAFALGMLCTGTGLVISVYRSRHEQGIDMIWKILLPVFFLSVAWSPAMQKIQLYNKGGAESFRKALGNTYSATHTRVGVYGTMSGATDQQTDTSGYSSSRNGGPNSSSNNMHNAGAASQRADDSSYISWLRTLPLDDLIDLDPYKSARWKNNILTSLWKLVFTPFAAIAFAKAFDIGYDFENFESFFEYWSDGLLYAFIINISTSLAGYLLSLFTCMMCMQVVFVLPLILSTPAAVGILFLPFFDGLFHLEKTIEDPPILLIIAGAAFFFGQFFTVGVFLFKKQTVVMEKESFLFWQPGYNGYLLDQWLSLSRKTKQIMHRYEEPIERGKRTRVYICTTMYRESATEMQQLLQSLGGINRAQAGLDKHFSAHIFFDGAVRDKKASDFLLILVSLVEETLNVKTIDATRVSTPYGMSLSWQLPAPPGLRGMTLTIHLKDNFKVKNKKRWSQVMYMSYVLDFLMKAHSDATDQETFILTTDADVKFSPESVESLMDNMIRDNTVGAVCARTHPMGSGPVVWYQIFDYAIGHWFQKAANDVLGSVLCCPGCFSVYRVAALRDVLPLYASKVTKAEEFLTKDMGEDRWLCTLMVQAGWRLEYSAAAHDETFCPEEFDEFFKQRRRWIPSTLANQFLIMKEWVYISKFNNHIRMFFALYQAFLIVSTLLGPGTVIMIIAGGLNYSLCVSTTAMTILLLIITVGYAAICLTTSQDTQLMVAKVMTFVFALVMAAVTVGTAVQIGEDIGRSFNLTGNTSDYKHCDEPLPPLEHGGLPLSTTSLYFMGIVGIFLVAGLMHLTESYALLHGVWYLLCLPSGYLLLMIYSICNITDRSWGTREEKKESTKVIKSHKTWKDRAIQIYKGFLCCCFYPQRDSVTRKDMVDAEVQTTANLQQQMSQEAFSSLASIDETRSSTYMYTSYTEQGSGGQGRTEEEELYRQSLRNVEGSFRHPGESRHGTTQDDDEAIPVEKWLDKELRKYSEKFIEQGFENTNFIAGMTEKELEACGVTVKAHRKAILEQIRQLPDYEIEASIPKDSLDWLTTLGLTQYHKYFKRNRIIHRKDFEILKGMSQEEIKKDLHVQKPGHLKFLLKAIKKLRWPTEEELRIQDARLQFDNINLFDMRAINKAEHDFWCSLRKRCLLPESKIFGTEDELKAKLVDLRNGYLMIFAVVNSLWLIFIMLLTNQKVLFLLGSNPLGLAFLFVFGFVLIIQFLAMIVHRFAAWMHMIARAPYKFGQPYHTNWAFNPQEEDFIDRRIAQEGQERARRRTEHNVEVRVRKKQVRMLPVSEVETSFKAGDNPDINTPLLRESRKSTSYVT